MQLNMIELARRLFNAVGQPPKRQPRPKFHVTHEGYCGCKSCADLLRGKRAGRNLTERQRKWGGVPILRHHHIDHSRYPGSALRVIRAQSTNRAGEPRR